MAYYVVKTIKGRPYLYRQESKRVGKRVRTRSTYLGPLGMACAAVQIGVRVATDKRAREILSFTVPKMPRHAVKTHAEGVAVMGPTDRAELGLAPQTEHMISTAAFDQTGAIVERSADKNEAAPVEGAAKD
jgi:hypothetical protein